MQCITHENIFFSFQMLTFYPFLFVEKENFQKKKRGNLIAFQTWTEFDDKDDYRKKLTLYYCSDFIYCFTVFFDRKRCNIEMRAVVSARLEVALIYFYIFNDSWIHTKCIFYYFLWFFRSHRSQSQHPVHRIHIHNTHCYLFMCLSITIIAIANITMNGLFSFVFHFYFVIRLINIYLKTLRTSTTWKHILSIFDHSKIWFDFWWAVHNTFWYLFIRFTNPLYAQNY